MHGVLGVEVAGGPKVGTSGSFTAFSNARSNVLGFRPQTGARQVVSATGATLVVPEGGPLTLGLPVKVPSTSSTLGDIKIGVEGPAVP